MKNLINLDKEENCVSFKEKILIFEGIIGSVVVGFGIYVFTSISSLDTKIAVLNTKVLNNKERSKDIGTMKTNISVIKNDLLHIKIVHKELARCNKIISSTY